MPTQIERQVTVPTRDGALDGELVLPEAATGLVVLARDDGSISARRRDDAIAAVLRTRGLGTLSLDLLTDDEGRVPRAQFDLNRLTDRVLATTEWLRDRGETGRFPVGYCGSGTGAAAALCAAARRSDVGAVVSCSGRVDLATPDLPSVRAPTLLVAGGAEPSGLALNRAALDALGCEADLAVIDGAGDSFDGPGELEAVADHTAAWFGRHLG